MEDLDLLTDLLTVFVVAAAVVFLFHKLRLPALVGLLAAGVLVGPSGLQLIHEAENVRLLAEVGVVVLLFTVGLEFSLSRLVRSWDVMLAVALPQVLICGAVAFLATLRYFEAWEPAVFAGMLVAMSSTAVVLKVLIDRGELSSPQGRIAVAVLLFQDLLVMVFMLALPLLAQEKAATRPWLALGQGVLVMLAILLATRFVIPRVLFRIVQTRNRELFLLAIVALCLGTATLTAATGLSLALGAFLAGLALSDSEYAQQTLAEVLPFRDTLASLFFVSVGMLLDLNFVALNPGLVAATVAGLIALKFLSVALPLLICRYPLRLAVVAGLSLAQIGEFSFVLAQRGKELELLQGLEHQTFLAAAVITMAITPLVIGAAPWLANWLPVGRLKSGLSEEDEAAAAALQLDRHVIICGFGLNGRNVAHTLREVEIPFVVLEMNPVTVREQRRAGVPILFGDCAREPVLEHAGIQRAKALVVAISDPASTRRAVQAARALNARLHIIVRTRYLTDVDDLRKLGADEIVPEELETSVEIFARLLEHYDVPRNLIWDFVDRLRRDHYEMLRDERHSLSRVQLPLEVLSQLEVELVAIRADAPVVGQRLAEANLRARSGATVIAVRRGLDMLSNPGPDFVFEPRDIAILLGERPQLDQAILLLDPSLA